MFLTIIFSIIPPALLGGLFYLIDKKKLSFLFPIVSFYLLLIITYIINKNYSNVYYIETDILNSYNIEDFIVPASWFMFGYLIVIISYLIFVLFKKTKNKQIILGLRIFYLVFLGYFGIVLFVYFNQELLLFFPQKPILSNITTLENKYKDFKQIKLSVDDKIELSGYFLPRYSTGAEHNLKPIILYFGGNAEEVSNFFTYADKIPDYSIITFNYRGYGNSDGNPGMSIMDDTMKIYQYAKSYKVPITVIGRSIGTAFASKISAEKSKTKTVLITPFDSIKNVASESYWFLPVNMILRYRFDNERLLSLGGNNYNFLNSNIKYFERNDIGIFVAENDNVIPNEHGIRLFNSIKSKQKELFVIKSSGHNDILDKKDFWDKLNNFLEVN